MKTKWFETNIKVRFQHTDPAGLVFYPRYLEMINQVIEDWFSDELNVSFRELHDARKHGVPAVHVDVDFTKPSRLGDTLTFRLCVKRLGKTSMSLKIVGDCDGEIRINAGIVLVYVDVIDFDTAEIPESLRGRMTPFLCRKTEELL